MNRLGFEDFHAKHFGPEQKAYWQTMIQQQQQYYNNSQDCYDHSQSQQEQQEYEEYEEEEYQEGEYIDEEEHQLSKEAIEIFRFSEAYRKEREEERLKEEQDDTEGMQDWRYNESTVHVSGGIEAPATSLVLINKSAKKNQSDKISIQEELLNSAYLASCSGKDTPVILWPVLPLKM